MDRVHRNQKGRWFEYVARFHGGLASKYMWMVSIRCRASLQCQGRCRRDKFGHLGNWRNNLCLNKIGLNIAQKYRPGTRFY